LALNGRDFSPSGVNLAAELLANGEEVLAILLGLALEKRHHVIELGAKPLELSGKDSRRRRRFSDGNARNRSLGRLRVENRDSCGSELFGFFGNKRVIK
jgi:hypothetical protein